MSKLDGKMVAVKGTSICFRVLKTVSTRFGLMAVVDKTRTFHKTSDAYLVANVVDIETLDDDDDDAWTY